MTPSRQPFHPAALLPLPPLLVLLLLPALSRACSIPPAGCMLDKCRGLSTLAVPKGPYADLRVGWYYGLFNKSPPYNGNKTYSSVRGGPYINFEVFPQIEADYFLPNAAAQSVTSLSECCLLCVRTANCSLYQFFQDGNYRNIPIPLGTGKKATLRPLNFVDGQQCYLLTGGTVKDDGYTGTPFAGTHSKQISTNTSSFPNIYYPPSFVGGHCNPNASVVDDPHFVGAQGTHFDFNGQLGKTFCLISDERLHLNVLLDGYEDQRTFGATKLVNGKALRTWIKQVGLLWVSNGAEHSLVLQARAGAAQARGPGFLSSLILDGAQAPVPAPGQTLQAQGLSLRNQGPSARGALEVDNFALVVAGVLEAGIKLRPAQPVLQTPTDAQVHFNIDVQYLKATNKVHGVLGQTFKGSLGQEMKALEFRMLSKLLGGPIVADAASGAGFLEGSTKDYMTSGITARDSTFSVPLSLSPA